MRGTTPFVSSRRGRGAVHAALLLLGTLAWASTARGQQPGRRGCTLVLQPTTDSTRSVRIEEAADTYVTYVGGGLRWSCGSARMVADSAVRRPSAGRLRMIGDVDYRDSLRTLLADTVLYLEREDRILALGDVRLTRLATGSTLEGPRVEFLRGPGGELRRTVAVGRPRMTLRPDRAAADTAPPTRVDADSIVLIGEREARTWGDVRIRRPDLDARADSAIFRMDEGEGRLFGSPEVTGEAWTLTGNTIVTGFSEGELREVEAVEDARATGEDFRLFAPRIRARLADREIERLWARGEGTSVAFSPPYRLSGDSLVFRFAAGEIEELRSIGAAEAVEVGDSLPGDPLADIPLSAGDRSWVSGDTLELTFAGEGSGAGEAPSGGGAPLPDARDRAPGGEEAPATARHGAAAEGAVGRVPPAESLRRVETGADSAARDTASSVAAGGEPGGRDATPAPGRDRSLRRMRAVGDARAYYLLEAEAEGGRPPRHYQRGREIVIHFAGGTARRIEGEAAIGVHLDPTSGGDAPPPGGEGG